MPNILLVLRSHAALEEELPQKLLDSHPQAHFEMTFTDLVDRSGIPDELKINLIAVENEAELRLAIQQAEEIWFEATAENTLPDVQFQSIFFAAQSQGKILRLIRNLEPLELAEAGFTQEWTARQSNWPKTETELLVRQVSLIARQRKELSLRKLHLESQIRQVSMLRPQGPSIQTRFHFFRIKFIPEETWLENLYYRIRDSLYSLGRLVRKTLPLALKTPASQNSLAIPAWWSQQDESHPVYELLDLFWLEHPDAASTTLVVSAVPFSQADHRSVQLALKLRAQNSVVLYAYFRFDPSIDVRQTGQVSPSGIFQIPLDLVWANPLKILGTALTRKGPHSLIVEFPHPLMFRMVNLANQSGWTTIYNAKEDWNELKSTGLANWYDPAFEAYLSSNVSYKIYDLYGQEFQRTVSAPEPKSSSVPSLVPDWWKYQGPDKDLLRSLELFRRRHRDAGGCVALFSGVMFTRSEGQRATWLARAFARLGLPVVFIYFRFGDHEKSSPQPGFANVIQIPLDQLWAFPILYLSILDKFEGTKIFMAEFPHPALFRLLNLFSVNRWTTVYEAIDDWKEFKKVGQASWYDPAVESYILANAGLLTATAGALAKSVGKKSGRGVTLLPNAVEQDSLSPVTTSMGLPQGTITIGYFGHLTSSWFDWPLVIRTAHRNPGWMFHIIGYGNDSTLPVPSNIILPGKVPHEELPYYAASWDVAIIPFKLTTLSEAVNPIKVYEYLQLNLPVVTRGMPHLNEIPYVYNTNTREEFEAEIRAAAQLKPDLEVISQFLEKNTWSSRVSQLHELISSISGK